MSNSYRTAFAGSFASGVVISPMRRIAEVAVPDPEGGDVVDDVATRTSFQRSFDRRELKERSREQRDS